MLHFVWQSAFEELAVEQSAKMSSKNWTSVLEEHIHIPETPLQPLLALDRENSVRTGITHYRSGLSHEEDQLIPNLYRYDARPRDVEGCSGSRSFGANLVG